MLTALASLVAVDGYKFLPKEQVFQSCCKVKTQSQTCGVTLPLHSFSNCATVGACQVHPCLHVATPKLSRIIHATDYLGHCLMVQSLTTALIVLRQAHVAANIRRRLFFRANSSTRADVCGSNTPMQRQMLLLMKLYQKSVRVGVKVVCSHRVGELRKECKNISLRETSSGGTLKQLQKCMRINASRLCLYCSYSPFTPTFTFTY